MYRDRRLSKMMLLIIVRIIIYNNNYYTLTIRIITKLETNTYFFYLIHIPMTIYRLMCIKLNTLPHVYKLYNIKQK